MSLKDQLDSSAACAPRPGNCRMPVDQSQRLAATSLLAIAVLLLGAWFVRPGTALWLPSCPFHQLTGLYCPGCGTARMLYLLVHGHPLLAARENLMAVLLLPLAVVQSTMRLWGSTDLVSRRSLWRPGLSLAVALSVFTIIRNLPFEPFLTLAPLPLAQLLGSSD